MSGGHFDYGCFRISQFADELEHEIDTNNSKANGGEEYSQDTIDNLKIAFEVIDLAGRMAKEVEWLYSGDHGEESFNEIFTALMEKRMKTS